MPADTPILRFNQINLIMLNSDYQKGAIEISTIASMAIIATVVAAVSVVATMKYYEAQNAVPPAATATPILTANTTPEPTPDETANWETYTNNKYGFEIKYPSDWNVLGNVQSNETANANASTVSFWNPQTKILTPIIEKDSANNIDTIISREKTGLKNSTQKSVTIGGINAVKISGIISNGNMGAGESRDLYILNSKGTILKIALIPGIQE